MWLVVLCLFLAWFVFWASSKISINLNSRWLIIWTPENLNIWIANPGTTIERNFSTNFWIRDLRWTDTGHYTTIQCDGLYWPDDAVITWVQLSWSNVELMAGKPNDTYVYSNLNTWTDITTPKLFLYRNNVVSGGAINKFWIKPSIKINVPIDVPVGMYKWKITYTLYDYGVDIQN